MFLTCTRKKKEVLLLVQAESVLERVKKEYHFSSDFWNKSRVLVRWRLLSEWSVLFQLALYEKLTLACCQLLSWDQMTIWSFGQNKVVRHPVDHKHPSVSFYLHPWWVCYTLMADGLLKGSLHPIVDPGELEIEITLFLKDYCGCYMLSLPLSSFPTICVGSFVSFQLCSSLFDLTYTMNFITFYIWYQL